MADKRQVKDVKHALQHNIGLGGACVMAIYRKYNDKKGWVREDQTSDPNLLEKFEKASGNVVAKQIEETEKPKESFFTGNLKNMRPKL